MKYEQEFLDIINPIITNEEFLKRFSLKSQFLHATYFAFKDNLDGYLSYLKGKVFISKLSEKEEEILQGL